MAKHELLASVRDRYRESSRKDKSKILDEFIAVTGHHRKHGIRLLGQSAEGSVGTGEVKGRRIYDDAVRQVVILIWEASDRICGKRLKAAMPHLVESMEQHGHVDLDPEVKTRVLSASAATLDRLLKPVKATVAGRRKRRRQHVGLLRLQPGGRRRLHRLDRGRAPAGQGADPGGGGTGSHRQTAALSRPQHLLRHASVFINDTLTQYCADRGIEFTRSRAYRKNDQAWVEQKNGAVIRRFLGHERYSGQVAGQTIAHLHGAMRLYVNYFQPSFKLMQKTRNGSAVTKRYSRPATPCDRGIRHESVSAEAKAALAERRSTLDPVALLHTIREAQSALAAFVSLELRPTPRGESLERFLAKLPDRWREEQEPARRKPWFKSPRHWRTRKDPFEGVWCDVLEWLQEDPDASAMALLGRLQVNHPDRFSRANLRTLQRRVQQWRGIMASKLVYAPSEATQPGPAGLPEMELAATDPRC